MPEYGEGRLQVFSGNANPELAREICTNLGIEPGNIEVGRFSNGEIKVIVNENVRGNDVFVIQPTCSPPNDTLMELLLIIDALVRASAKRITAVVPYYGYARQDRKTRGREPITAKLVANLITTAGADRVLTMDLHAGQIQGFFDIPVDHLSGTPILADYIEQLGLEDMVVVSPDLGSVTRARQLAERMGVPIAIIDKRRPEPNVAEVMNLIGKVKGKVAIMVDDMIDTAGSVQLGAKALLENGAKQVYACCTHAVFSGPALSRLKEVPFKEVIVTNTIPVAKSSLPNLVVLSVAPLFAEAIRRIHLNQSVSTLFN